MDIDILGCSGGVSGNVRNMGTTCLRLGEHLLIDAGSGLSKLTLDEQRKIEDVLLTHSHMDHISDLPGFLANLFDHTDKPVRVHALPETIEILKDCVFNYQVWPDFTQLPTPQAPILEFVAIQPWRSFKLQGYEITPFFVEHSVPTVGFSIKDSKSHFVFSADTTVSETLIDELNRLGHIDTLMIECAFPDNKLDIARQSKHMTPTLVLETLDGLAEQPKKIWITHLKPAYDKQIRHDIRHNPDCHHWRVLP
ncbi:3',5'-cyclic-nucleotide phosphodiesterase [Aliidiomarina soli]|uniref:3',5'-cyclic-nucleotide phosphodiesterase n=1 Tax=Aliidiomarina soli TaxID=1928574 RepID=A0A432WGV9_9GAMM|nr:3',5'-cyclic-nucleotide phosphodiesterase [Aliidiomarina soli]RUO32971.1 3',5'-cyclic-nucleotide phosphodiesterase [Aliidiomarina soli]